jgi:hypothetical protein
MIHAKHAKKDAKNSKMNFAVHFAILLGAPCVKYGNYIKES